MSSKERAGRDRLFEGFLEDQSTRTGEEDTWFDLKFEEYRYERELPRRSRCDHAAGGGATGPNLQRRCDDDDPSHVFAYAVHRDIPTDSFHGFSTDSCKNTRGEPEMQNLGSRAHQDGRDDRTGSSQQQRRKHDYKPPSHYAPPPEDLPGLDSRCETLPSNSPPPSPPNLTFNNPFIPPSPSHSSRSTSSRSSSVRSPHTPFAPGMKTLERAWTMLKRREKRLRGWETALEARERLVEERERETEGKVRWEEGEDRVEEGWGLWDGGWVSESD